jgi:flagellar hook-associated protein 3 FlgL
MQSLQKQTSSLAKLQIQLASGKAIVNPSDNPTGTRQILLHNATLGKLESRVSTIQTVRNWLTHSETQLTDAQDILVRAREIALQGRQSTDVTERRNLSAELDTMLERLVSIANTKNEGLYLYGGNQSGTQPYSIENGRVFYQGSDTAVSVPSGDGVELPMLYTGTEVFGAPDRGETIVVGITGLKAGSGTDTGVGQSEVTVRHVATTFAGASGIQTGASSGTFDTIIGPVGSHTLTIRDTSGTGASGTISLNDGPEVAFTSSDQNLKVIGNNGEVIYVDTQNITAGFNGTINVGASGTLSSDGGATETPINFASQVQLTNSQTGEITYLDTSAVRRAGVANVEYTGTADAFSALTELRDALLNENSIGSEAWQGVMTRRIGDIERLQDHLYDVRGAQAVSQQQLNQLQERTEDLQLETKQNIADIENVDLTDVVIQLQEAQNQMQFALAAIARVNDASLLNYLS